MPSLDPVEHPVKIERRDRGEASFPGGIISRVRGYRRLDIARRVPLVRPLPLALRCPALSPLLVPWRLPDGGIAPDGDRWHCLRDEARAARPPGEWRFVAPMILPNPEPRTDAGGPLAAAQRPRVLCSSPTREVS